MATARPDKSTIAVTLLLVAAVLAGLPAAAAADPPARHDHGAVVVLDVAGSAKAMGRQQVALMPGLAAAAARLLDPNDRTNRGHDKAAAPAQVPKGAWAQENAGIAEALGLPPEKLAHRRRVAPLPGHTTAAVGPRASARAGPMLARNIAQTDRGHRRRPVVVRYQPAGGQAFLQVGWPLMATPSMGLNASGVAISLQPYAYRGATPDSAAPRVYRRAIQEAGTAAEAAEIITTAPRRPVARLVTLADGATLRALACLPHTCRDLAVAGGKLALTDHTGEPGWAHLEHWNRPASRQRRATVRQSLTAFDGGFYGMPAAALLRSRAPGGHGNDPATVAHAGVLASVIVAPKRRSLWIATAAPPIAPFGRFTGISLRPGERTQPGGLPPAPSVAAREAGEAPALTQLRGAARALESGAPALAQTRLAGIENGHLQPGRQTWLDGLSLARRGELAASRARLAAIDSPASPRLALYTALLEAELARRQGSQKALRDALARAGRRHAQLDGARLPKAETILTRLARGDAVALRRFPVLAGVPARP